MCEIISRGLIGREVKFLLSKFLSDVYLTLKNSFGSQILLSDKCYIADVEEFIELDELDEDNILAAAGK